MIENKAAQFICLFGSVSERGFLSDICHAVLIYCTCCKNVIKQSSYSDGNLFLGFDDLTFLFELYKLEQSIIVDQKKEIL